MYLGSNSIVVFLLRPFYIYYRRFLSRVGRVQVGRTTSLFAGNQFSITLSLGLVLRLHRTDVLLLHSLYICLQKKFEKCMPS